MADPIVAPDVVRYTVNQRHNGRTIANIIDLVVLDQVGPMSRDDAVRSAAGDVMDAWDQYVRGGQHTSLVCESVSWVDLNSLSGSTGDITETADTIWPANGGAEGQALPNNVAILVVKQTTSGRGSRNGRMYLAGATEQVSLGNELDPGYLGVITGDFGNFTEALTETGVIADYQTFPTVIHTRNIGTEANPNIVYQGNTQVVSFAPQGLLATQRRRLRG